MHLCVAYIFPAQRMQLWSTGQLKALYLITYLFFFFVASTQRIGFCYLSLLRTNVCGVIVRNVACWWWNDPYLFINAVRWRLMPTSLCVVFVMILFFNVLLECEKASWNDFIGGDNETTIIISRYWTEDLK